MKKVIISHRAALYFNKGYLHEIFMAEGYAFMAEVKLEERYWVKLGQRVEWQGEREEQPSILQKEEAEE